MAIALSGSLILSGSITVSGSIISTGTISMSGSIASASYATNATSASYANNATTASYALNATTGAYANTATSASYALNATTFNGLASSIFATTGSNTFIGTQTITGSVLQSGSFTTTGTIIAQTINVQQVTSSIVYSCGSNIFGTNISNTQQLTGSVGITGSLTIAGASSATSYNGATIFGSTIACSPIGCFATSCATSFIGGTMSGTTIYGSTAVCSPVGKFTSCIDAGSGTFSGNVAVGTIMSVGSNAGAGSLFQYTYSGANASSRTWRTSIDNVTYGDWVLQQATTQGGSTYANILIFCNTGAATFSSTITGTTIYGSTAVCSAVGKFTTCLDLGGALTGTTALFNLNASSTLALTSAGTNASMVKAGSGDELYIGGNDTWQMRYSGGNILMDNGGCVGIGTSSPAAALNVSCVPSSYFGIIETTGTSTGTVKHFRVHKPNCVEYGIGILADNSFHISTASTFPTTNGLTLTSGGKLLIGTTTTGYGLFSEQRVTICPTNDGITIGPLRQNYSAYTLQADNNTGVRYALYITNGSSDIVGNISFTSAAVSYNTTSDYRLKEDLKEIKALEKVSAIKVYDFKWKASDDRMDGFLAHELQEVLPYAVTGQKDAEQMQGVDYSKLVPILVKGMQEQQCTICTQASMINTLKTCLGIN